MENNENTNSAGKRKTIYDGIKISERGRDIIVFSLSLLLIICFVIAFITAK